MKDYGFTPSNIGTLGPKASVTKLRAALTWLDREFERSPLFADSFLADNTPKFYLMAWKRTDPGPSTETLQKIVDVIAGLPSQTIKYIWPNVASGVTASGKLVRVFNPFPDQYNAKLYLWSPDSSFARGCLGQFQVMSLEENGGRDDGEPRMRKAFSTAHYPDRPISALTICLQHIQSIWRNYDVAF